MVAVFRIRSESFAFMNVCRTFDYIGTHVWYSLPRLPRTDLGDISHNLSYSLKKGRELRFFRPVFPFMLQFVTPPQASKYMTSGGEREHDD
jgi:hypothetical protein